MGRSESDIKKLCPDATVLPGFAVYGSMVASADDDLMAWLKEHNLL